MIVLVLLAELAASVVLLALIVAVMQHACDPRRIDRQSYVGRHHQGYRPWSGVR